MVAAAGWAGARLSGSRAPEARPERPVFRGLRSFDDLRALAVGPRSTAWLADRGLPPATIRFACAPSPCPPCRSTHLPLEEWRVSAHRGLRQPARHPNAANEILAGQPRGREASANRLTRSTTATLFRRLELSISKREADPFARQDELRSVRTAPRLSRPSMGRDTLCIPSNSVASGRMGRGSERRRIGSLRAKAPGPPTTPPSAARWRARGGRRSYGARGRPAVQAGLQMHVSRRAEPRPSLPHAITPPGRQARSAWPKRRRQSPPSPTKQFARTHRCRAQQSSAPDPMKDEGRACSVSQFDGARPGVMDIAPRNGFNVPGARHADIQIVGTSNGMYVVEQPRAGARARQCASVSRRRSSAAAKRSISKCCGSSCPPAMPSSSAAWKAGISQSPRRALAAA